MPASTDRLIVITGCSGGGKSTLVEALAARGHAVVREHGRRLLRAELAAGGTALPWADPDAFLRRMIALALADLAAAAAMPGIVFFDRSLIDALSGLEHRTGEPLLATLGTRHRYRERVFVAPPWPAIYGQDDERRHDLAAARREHHRLRRDYAMLGYELIELPRLSVSARADFVLAQLAMA